MLGSDVFKKLIKIFAVDFINCCKNVRRGMEPWTNGVRALAILLGLVVGGAVTGSVAPNLVKDTLASISGYEANGLVGTTIDVGYVALGLMVGAQIFGLLAKTLMLSYYFCRYRTRELYKPMTFKEIEIIHNNIAALSHSEFKSIPSLRDSISGEGYTQEQICSNLHTVLAGTFNIFEEIRREVLHESEGTEDPKSLNERWLSVRTGRIESVCLSDGNYVKSVLFQAIPFLNPETQNINTIIRRMSLSQGEALSQSHRISNPNAGPKITIEMAETKREPEPETTISKPAIPTVVVSITPKRGLGAMFSETANRLDAATASQGVVAPSQ